MAHRKRNTLGDAVVVAVVLAGIGSYFRFWKHSANSVFLYLIIAAIMLLSLALLSKTFRDIFSKYWMKLGEGLGYVNSKIILSIIFVLMLLPLAALRKLFAGNSPDIRSKKESSMWIVRKHHYTAEDLKKMW